MDKEARRELYLVAYSLYLLAGLELASYYLDSGGILAKNRSNLKKREKERERALQEKFLAAELLPPRK